ncbi:leucine-rich repeat-containing protein 56 isoform X2 [Protopterus annectens]|nr:leucine-rich repeat-containing protein 56 isoform X2 [Protopterus annectens]
MYHHQTAFQTARPGTATIRVTDLGDFDLINPNPVSKEDSEILVDEYLSPAKLLALTGAEDLKQVKTLEMLVYTQENSLGNFGAYLPNLIQLKLNNSMIASVRDLGTTLSHLKVLWMSRCGLIDLDGIPSFCSLKELYLAYNNISDLSQVSMLDHLEILDLEGNNIDETIQIQYLGLCNKLNTLTLEGNPMCLKPYPNCSETQGYNYRAEIRKLIPHLKYLDDIPASMTNISPVTNHDDWLIVKKSIKDFTSKEDPEALDEQTETAERRPGSSVRPSTGKVSSQQRPWTAHRPSSANRPGSARPLFNGNSRPDSASSDDIAVEDEASALTHGIGKVICGNPVKALCLRKQKLESASISSETTSRWYSFIPEHSYDNEENGDREDIFSELRAWRKAHDIRLESIRKDREPQTLKINHSDEEEDAYDCAEDECSTDDSYDEDLKATKFNSCSRMFSSDSLSSPPLQQAKSMNQLHVRENASATTAVNSSISPSPPLCPSPPQLQGTKNRPHKSNEFRTRRLRIPLCKEEKFLQEQTERPDSPERHAIQADEEFTVEDNETTFSAFEDLRLKIKGKNCAIQDCYESLQPVSGPAILGPQSNKHVVDKNPQKSIDNYPPVIRCSALTTEKPIAFNPIRSSTARAALQRLPNRPPISPNKSRTDI